LDLISLTDAPFFTAPCACLPPAAAPELLDSGGASSSASMWAAAVPDALVAFLPLTGSVDLGAPALNG
jgi:hypothetical protein